MGDLPVRPGPDPFEVAAPTPCGPELGQKAASLVGNGGRTSPLASAGDGPWSPDGGASSHNEHPGVGRLVGAGQRQVLPQLAFQIYSIKSITGLLSNYIIES